jgi:hypothetical protein
MADGVPSVEKDCAHDGQRGEATVFLINEAAVCGVGPERKNATGVPGGR